MPRYDYRCRQCEQTFEIQQPIAAAHLPAVCPAGHRDVTRVWSAVSLAGRAPAASAAAPTGGCCGGGCCG